MKDHQRASIFPSFLLTWVLGIALDVLCQWPLQGKSNPCVPGVTWWISLTWHFSRLEAARQVAAAWSVDDERMAGWDSRLWKLQQEILGVRQHAIDESAAFGQSPMDVQRALAVGEAGWSVEEASAQISVSGRILGLFDCDLAGLKVECMGPLLNKAPLPWKTTQKGVYSRWTILPEANGQESQLMAPGRRRTLQCSLRRPPGCGKPRCLKVGAFPKLPQRHRHGMVWLYGKP